jgi:hypothetical protein
MAEQKQYESTRRGQARWNAKQALRLWLRRYTDQLGRDEALNLASQELLAWRVITEPYKPRVKQ